MTGYMGTQFEELYSLASAVTKNTYTTQAPISAAASTSVDRCELSAKFFSAINKTIRAKFWGTIGSAAGTATFIMAAGLDATGGTIAGTGGATLFTTGTVTPTTTTVPFEGEFDLTCQAVGNLGTTVQCNGWVQISAAASSTWSGTAPQKVYFANNLTGINNEIPLFLELFGTWSASAAGNTTTLQQFKVYGEN